MDLMFTAVPIFISAVAIMMGWRTWSGYQRLRTAWASGLTAEGCCLRTYITTSLRSNGPGEFSSTTTTTLHHVYEFQTPQGEVTRFEETGGPAIVVQGDIVTIYYPREQPSQATARPPSSSRRAAGEAVVTLCFVGVVIAFCLFFVSL